MYPWGKLEKAASEIHPGIYNTVINRGCPEWNACFLVGPLGFSLFALDGDGSTSKKDVIIPQELLALARFIATCLLFC